MTTRRAGVFPFRLVRTTRLILWMMTRKVVFPSRRVADGIGDGRGKRLGFGTRAGWMDA